jgi:hypothetical protein
MHFFAVWRRLGAGMENFMTGRLLWLRVMMVNEEQEMCLAGSYLEIAGTVNSPRRAMQ